MKEILVYCKLRVKNWYSYRLRVLCRVLFAKATSLLLDLSAAFDTVDHSVLLRRLQSSFRMSGAPLNWFKSYLSARSQRVSIPGALSDSLPLNWGVPRGSCIGSLLYIIYSSNYLTSLNVIFQILTVMRMIYIFRVSQKFVPLLYKSVFQCDWTW